MHFDILNTKLINTALNHYMSKLFTSCQDLVCPTLKSTNEY